MTVDFTANEEAVTFECQLDYEPPTTGVPAASATETASGH